MDLRLLALVAALCCVAYGFEFNVEDMPQEFRGKYEDPHTPKVKLDGDKW